MLRRFRSSAPATIWHESVDDQSYRLATGYEDVNQQLLLSSASGLHIRRLTIDGGLGSGSNAGIDIRRGPNEASHFNFMDYRTGQDVRNGWFGFGDLTTKDFIWWNDNGQNSINLIENGELHITGGKGQKIVMNSEVALSENARLAVKGGNYGLIFRNDGSGFHLLTTDLKILLVVGIIADHSAIILRMVDYIWVALKLLVVCTWELMVALVSKTTFYLNLVLVNLWTIWNSSIGGKQYRSK